VKAQASSRKFYFPPELETGECVLAVGTEADNSLCLVKGPDAYLSTRIGNLRDPDSFDAFKLAIDQLKELAGAQPTTIAHDMNPDCLAAKYARQLESVRLVPVQQHFAHVASCMAEHGETGRVIGVVYDEVGCGEDGAIRGAEFLSATPAGYRRLGHLRQVRWPGGKRAGRDPWRIAMAFIHLSYGYQTPDIAYELFKNVPKEKINGAFEILESGQESLLSPLGSSMAAFFDALSAISAACSPAVRPDHAAELLESTALQVGSRAALKPYSYDIIDSGTLVLVDPAAIVYEAVENALSRKSPGEMATKFLETVVAFTIDVCVRLRERVDIDKVVLTGAIFRSRYLLGRTIDILKKEGFRLLTHGVVPPDGPGISLGQAYAARARLAGEKAGRQKH
jgi:hydrogenase maturation protein HypF